MAKALIQPEMVQWARERAGLSRELLAKKIKIKPEQLTTWESGEDAPTFRQAETIAKQTHIPFGYLFLPEPPKEELPIPDLRTRGGVPPEPLGADFFDLINDVLYQRDWYKEFLLENGADILPFVNRFHITESVDKIAKDIHKTLELHSLDTSPTWEEYLDNLYERCEAVGIWIMRSGFIGSNTQRTLSVQAFRGFTISDAIVPLIFINGRDAKAAQAFTLAHELAHVWTGNSGISNVNLDDTSMRTNARVERTCNAIAAELLTPKKSFLAAWNDRDGLPGNVDTLSKTFKVSGIVIARRAMDLGKIGREEFRLFCEQEQRLWQQKEKKGGGNYYRTIPIKHGRQFTNAVLHSAMSGKLLLREAGALLHMNPAKLPNLLATTRRSFDVSA
ncbi:MAG: ImmA/IrrE family metallo-endopeptidase [Magnetococcales bacterium]|nr:ImmA/IrrE family metallo-endopeptidase [Magnetococcales bacterium]